MQKYKKSYRFHRLSRIFYNISHQQPLQLRYFYPATMQFNESSSLKLVKNARHIQPTVIHLLRQSFHQDVESLRTGRIETV